MCEHFVSTKGDFIYRGDIIEDVPFVSLDGKTIYVNNNHPDAKNPFVPLWKRQKASVGALSCLADLQLRRAVVMTRTCESDKFSGVKRVYPAIYLAPIRPLSDFDREGESGAQFAKKISKGFPPDDETGDVTECYRFAFLPECSEHEVQAGLICFREMQPVHLKYLVDNRKSAHLSRSLVHAVSQRFAQYMMQRETDDASDAEPEGEISRTIATYRNERAAERAAR